ncbi:MAG: hypothetical protein MI723_17550 [Caulobacterales bacterium]|nr:hypothetical protein [Caulobacterales bacterium]
MPIGWGAFLRYWNAVRPCWFAVVIVLGVCATILAAGQMRDILEYSVDRNAQEFGVRWPLFFLYLESAILSISAWYFCRAALLLEYPFTYRASDLEFPRKWMPRWLGVIVPLSIAIGFAMRGGALLGTELSTGPLLPPADASVPLANKDWLKLCAHAGYFTLLAIGLFLFYVNRQKVPFFRDAPGGGPYDLRPKLNARVWVALIFLLAHSFILLVCIILWPVGAPRLIGTGGLVLGAAAAWLAMGTLMIILFSRSGGPPVIASLLVIAGVFSFWNDNHGLKTLPLGAFDENAEPVAERASFEAHAWRWLLDRESDIRARSADSPYPVVFLAAEGGGIRAAYVTGVALAKLEDLTACALSEHMFGMAGVSGGSVGVAGFLASRADLADSACAELRGQDLAERQRRSVGAESGLNAFEIQARAFLKQDYLSPALAGLFFVDIPARFSFLPYPASQVFVDRAWFMEESLVRGWGRVIGTDRPMTPVWSAGLTTAVERGGVMGMEMSEAVAASAPVTGDGRTLTGPAVVFTTVSVKTGRQWAVSNVRVDEDDWELRRDLLRVLDGSLTLAQAAHMSARFTYVSPAATAVWSDCVELRAEPTTLAIDVRDVPQGAECESEDAERPVQRVKRRDRFVDGAYFENSGAAALERMMQAFERVVNITCREGDDAEARADIAAHLPEREAAAALALPCLSSRLSLHALVLDSDPAVVPDGVDPQTFRRAELAALEAAVPSDGFLSESMSPLQALFATRGERGREAVYDLYVALRARRDRFREGRTIDDTREIAPKIVVGSTIRPGRIPMPRPRVIQEMNLEEVRDRARARMSERRGDYAPARELLEQLTRAVDQSAPMEVEWTCEDVNVGADGGSLDEGWHQVRVLVDETDRDGLRVPLGWMLAASSARTIERSLARDCAIQDLADRLGTR